jgi:UDP-glucose 4-epimerase
MKIIVTGGCGFIGSHLVEKLLMDNHEVIVIDNLSTGRMENVWHLLDNNNLKVVVSDVADFDLINPLFSGVDWVFHLAALADIVPSIENPLAYHRANVGGTISVLEASRLNGVKRFLYSASSSCYGIPAEYPTPENASIEPKYPYATTKYLGEEYVMNWNKIYKLSTTSVRFFNVYGTRSRTSGTYGAVFGVFLAQKLNGKPYTVVGDGTQMRDFTYVTDVADACIAVMKCEKAAGQIYNVGSGGTYTINKLVSELRGEVTYIPKRPGEPACTHADISKIKNEIGWSPVVSFEEGVSRILEDINYWRDAPVWEPESIKRATKTWFEVLD